MTNSNIWDCLTPLQTEVLRELSDSDYRRTMDTIHMYVLEGMDIKESIIEVIGEII